jgi:hypothetical protein
MIIRSTLFTHQPKTASTETTTQDHTNELKNQDLIKKNPKTSEQHESNGMNLSIKA